MQSIKTALWIIRRFFAPLMQEPGYFWRFIVKHSLLTGDAIINVLFVKEIVHVIEIGNTNQLGNYVLWYVAYNIFYFGSVIFVRHWGWAESAHHLLKVIHHKVMRQFNELDNTYAESIGTGRIVSIVAKGSETWMTLIVNSMESLVRLIVSIIWAMYILSVAGWMATVVFIGFFIIVHIGVYYLNEFALQWRKGRIDSMNEYDRHIVKMIMSKFEILQNGKIDQEVATLDRYVDLGKYYNIGLNNYLVAMFNMPNVAFFAITLAVFIAVMKTPLPFSEIASIFMMTGLLKNTMENSIDFFKNFTKSSYTVSKMWKLLDEAPRLTGLTDGIDFSLKEGVIEVKNMSFSYGNSSIFQDFSLTLSPHKKTALVGLSGSGKSTLVKLIAGYIRPTEGAILVDGQDLSTIKLGQYYRHIGYLTQEPSVFDGTIRENLIYGAWSEVTEELLKAAIKQSECEFVYEFQDGLDTEIGEKWIRLSGWQRQRLAIAKIFIKNPEIVILDEPTSALDSFSEEKISKAFHNLFAGRTVIVIAHRLQTVKEADDIIVLERANIVERGNHESLSKIWGVYTRMLELQSGF